jgi:N-acetylglucosamine-6-sulfatase
MRPLRTAHLLTPILVLSAVALAVSTGLTTSASARPLAQGAGVSTHRVDARPNFVVIQTDDQTVQDLAVMPNVKRLLQDKGTTFSEMMTPFAICCPSRAAMMSACYPHNNHVNANFPPDGGYAVWQKYNHDKFIGAWLKDAGYHTVHIGKYINGYGYMNNPKFPTPGGWSEWHGSTDTSTYQMYGYRLNEPDGSHVYGNFNVENPRYYSTDVYRGIAEKVITDQARKPGPFYLQVAFLAPHVETVPLKKVALQNAIKNMVDVDDPAPSTGIQSIPPRPAKRHENALKNMKLDVDPSFNEADVSDKQSFIRNLPLLTDTAIQSLVDDNRQRRQSLLAVDEAVNGIVKTLTKTGQLDNTYIIFVGDNGYVLGQHRISKGKYFPYDPALNIPFIVRGPGVKAGVTMNQMVTLMDITPTVLDLAGAVPTGREPDGISLVKSLKFGTPIVDRTLLLSSGPQKSPAGVPLPLFNGVRDSRYAYWKYEDGFEELYDLAIDPYEMQSVASDPAYVQVKAALAAEWNILKDCAGASCRVASAVIPEPVKAG